MLLAAPAGPRCTLGIDPGLRTGCKIAVVDATGKVLETTTVYPHVPHNKWNETITTLAALCKKHHVQLIAIGNGTGSRESDRLAIELVKLLPELHMSKVMVSEAGASVYSASELAALEFPDLDVSLRGAVSIARRLQDPPPKWLKSTQGLWCGQYQHDSRKPIARSWTVWRLWTRCVDVHTGRCAAGTMLERTGENMCYRTSRAYQRTALRSPLGKKILAGRWFLLDDGKIVEPCSHQTYPL